MGRLAKKIFNLMVLILLNIIINKKRCNKVACICGCILCYVCGKQISGYEHFQEDKSKCNLWSNTAVYRIVERPRHEVRNTILKLMLKITVNHKPVDFDIEYFYGYKTV